MKRAFLSSAIVLCLSATGCAAVTSSGPPAVPPIERPDAPVSGPEKAKAEASFSAALGEMARLDARGAWTREACEDVARRFLEAAGERADDLAARATFNAGVARERCGDDAEAKGHFERSLALSPGFHPAAVHLILLEHRAGGGKDLNGTIAALRKAAIVDARYGNVEALVALAMLCLERDSAVADTDGPNDRARAVRYLQSALAVDDSYSPAMNGLALYHLAEARGARGARRVGSGAQGAARPTQAMELAALVCAQALRKNPKDAVIHNTYGLIQVELGNTGKAAEAFGEARELSPGFYEAEMNFAAVNLQFRGFSKAEEAYRAVLKSRPDDYDARVGLALALRGQIREDNAEKLVAEASAELAKAKKIAPARPEAYFNEAILTQEYKARGEGVEAERQLVSAKSLFEEFIKLAGSSPEYKEGVKSAQDRIKDILDMQVFMGKKPDRGS